MKTLYRKMHTLVLGIISVFWIEVLLIMIPVTSVLYLLIITSIFDYLNILQSFEAKIITILLAIVLYLYIVIPRAVKFARVMEKT